MWKHFIQYLSCISSDIFTHSKMSSVLKGTHCSLLRVFILPSFPKWWGQIIFIQVLLSLPLHSLFSHHLPTSSIPLWKQEPRENARRGYFLSSVYNYLNLVSKAKRGVTLFMWVFQSEKKKKILLCSSFPLSKRGKWDFLKRKKCLAENITQNANEIILKRVIWAGQRNVFISSIAKFAWVKVK